MEAIFNPILPPKKGYVEVVNGEGKHVYQPTLEQLEKDNQQKLIASLSQQQAQSDLVAVTAFEAQLATDAAIVSIFEKISTTTTGGATV